MEPQGDAAGTDSGDVLLVGRTIERATAVVHSKGLVRYRDIIRGGGHRWVIDLERELPMAYRRLPSGLYASMGEYFGPVTQALTKARGAVVCLATALWIHGLIDEPPREVHLAIGHSARKPKWTFPAARFFHMSRRLLSSSVELIRVDSIRIPVFSVARTVVDSVRFRAEVGPALAHRAIERGLRAHVLSEQSLLSAAVEARAKGWMQDELRRLREVTGRETQSLERLIRAVS